VTSALRKFDGIESRDFDVVITREAGPPKPSPEGVIRAAENMGCLAEELIVVGVFRFDVIAGKRAGARTILLTNGEKSTMAPGDPKPDYICGDLNEVVEIVLHTISSL
jgi:phosphoglycolate phosphatase-like HAD superfamily hydrolase